MFYSRISRISKGGLFVFTCALFLKRGTSLLIIGLMMTVLLPALPAKAAIDISLPCSGTEGTPTSISYGIVSSGADIEAGEGVQFTGTGWCSLTNSQDETGGDAYMSLDELIIDSGVTLTHTGSGTTANLHNELDLVVAGNVTINGNINVNGKGYQTEYTVGNTKTGGAGLAGAGGSHGGRGGNGSYTASVPASYGYVDHPTYGGPIYPGGGGGRYGEDGGGVIRITSTSGTIAVNADISARGNDSPGYEKGGGAGGSIYLKAGTITLASGKTISANGGDDNASVRDGAGGGGRITLEYTTFTDSGGTITAYGGDASEADEDGSAGTVYYNDTDGDQDLYITPFSGAETDYATELDSDSDGVFDNVFLSNNARLYLHSDATGFSTTYINVPTGSLFESDADVSFSSIDTTTLFLDGGIAKFDGGLTLTTFDTTGGSETGTLITNGITYITSGAPVIGSGLTWEANSDTIKQSSGTNLTDLTVKSGGILSNSGSTPNNYYDLELTMSGTLSVEDGGLIDVSGKGYLGGYGTNPYYQSGYLISLDSTCTGDGECDYNRGRSGLTVGYANGSYYTTGGSHGGRGGSYSSDAVAASYDSISNPIYPGSGGGGDKPGGNGGGVVRITAPIITVAGNIIADGDDGLGEYGAAGGGGTIYLDATGGSITLNGGRFISADGGDDYSDTFRDGAGGGGRIALIYPSGQFTETGTVTAYGGDGESTVGGNIYDSEDGSAGTIYHLNGATKNLYIDANNLTQMHYATEIDEDVDEAFDNVYLSNNARLFLNSNASAFSTTILQIPTGTYFESDRTESWVKIDTTNLYLNGGTAKFDGQLTLTDPSAGFDTDDDDAETGTLITNGLTYISSGVVEMGSGLTWEANSDTIKQSSGTNLDSITVTSGATLTHGAATPNTIYDLELTLDGTLTVDDGGSIHADSKGYMGAYSLAPYYQSGIYIYGDYDCTGDGECDRMANSRYGDTVSFVAGSYYPSGGSHGGRGGTWSTGNAIASEYDSISNPIYAGSGGGGDGNGGEGGGVIRITADIMSLNDDVTADGGIGGGYYDGAGGGGTVNLNATTSISLAGGKVISANGGDDANGGRDGGGGGGRVAVVSASITNSGSITAHGGNGTAGDRDDGAAGTVFLRDTDDTYGDLYIENCFDCTTPEYHTSLLDIVPADDQSAAYGNGYAYENTTTSQNGVLNISSAIEGGTRQFHCNNCTPADDDTLSNGEIVYDTELFSVGLTANYTCVGLNAVPTASVSSVVQRTDGSGIVDIEIVLNDADTGDTLTAKIEYSVGVGCGGGSDPALDEASANVSGSQGTPVVENDDVYQISSVIVASGANTVQFDWDSATDIPSGDGTYCLIVTPNDGTTDGTPATKTYTADNADPTGLAALTVDGRTALSILLGWSEVTETNFDHYEVWYGLSQVDVQGRTGSVAEWDDSDDGDLGTITTTDTTITGLTPNIGNFFKIWAVDTFGNVETVTDIQAYTDANTPGAPTVVAGASDALNVVIDENSNPSTTEYAIKVGALYVQANGTLGASEVWQTYTTWGGAVGIDATGLSANTSYDVSVKARNGDDDETSLSTQTSKYTYAAPVTDVSLVETAGGMDLYWTDAGQAGLEIYLAKKSGSVCDSTYDILEYDDSAVNPASPRGMGAGADDCHRVRIGSYNDDGDLNTAEYAFSGDLVISPTSSSSGGSSGGSSTAFYSLLSNVSRAEKIAIDIAEKEELEKAVEEEKEFYDEDKKVFEEEIKKPIFDFDEKYVKEPIRIYAPLEPIYKIYELKVYERITPKFKLASELDFKYVEFKPVELERSIKDYFDDDRMKKELLRDVIEEFADEFMKEDFAKDLLEELSEDLGEEIVEEFGEGEEEYDLREATDEVLEEILGEDMEDIDVFEPELEVDDDAEEVDVDEEVEEVVEEDLEEEVELEEEKTELEKDVELEEEAVEILEELTVEEIADSGVSEVVEDSIKGSVRKAIEVGDAVEVHTDMGVYIVDDVEDIVAIIEELDEEELEKMDLDGDGMNDLWQMSHGYTMFNSDPDGDGISTSVEVYCGWDPLSMDSLNDNLASTKVANLKGNTFGNMPAIRACGEEGSLVDVVLFDVDEVFGNEKFESEDELAEKLIDGISNATQNYAGSMIMDESNQGIMLPFEELEDGKYIVMLSGEDGIEHISTLTVENDAVPGSARMEIGSKGLRLGFVIGNTLHLAELSVAGFNADFYISSFPGAAVPVITGQIADFESLTVIATWRSRTLSSTAFADASDGTFELEIPNSLPLGAHDIIVYLRNENAELVSSATVLQFVK